MKDKVLYYHAFSKIYTEHQSFVAHFNSAYRLIFKPSIYHMLTLYLEQTIIFKHTCMLLHVYL